MTETPVAQNLLTSVNQPAGEAQATPRNPYVGPRTFTLADRNWYFGRAYEARDLLSLVIAERLTLFYAQSGAGKSSLLNTQLIPALREQARYLVLPVGRVGGELPAGIDNVANIYTFNLLLSLDQNKESTPARFAQMMLADFLAGLRTRDGQYYVYDEATAQRATQTRPNPQSVPRNQPPHVLVIDQFEELVTTHPQRWREREAFFRQLGDAMRADPLLWVVLTLREDFIAPLDPFAHHIPGSLTNRFYMQRMGVDAALEAIKRPAERASRPFAEGVAETLVDNLRRIKVAGQAGEQLGQYVEPVQLQVVCYQLWEKLQVDKNLVDDKKSVSEITQADLQRAGDVDTALSSFYEDAIHAVLTIPAIDISERRLRTWFDEELITEAGTRGTVYRGEETTAGMPNAVVDALQQRFLLRTELRAGGAWVELVHDRFVEPVQTSNRHWRERYNNPLAMEYQRWIQTGRSDDRLLSGENLNKAITFVQNNSGDVTDEERSFLKRSQNSAKRQARQRWLLVTITTLLLILFASLARYGLDRANVAEKAQATAEANVELANQQLTRLEGLRLYQQGEKFKAEGKIDQAITAYTNAATADPTLGIDLSATKADVYRQAAILQIQEGERFAFQGNWEEAKNKFQYAIELNPPPGTPIYIWISPGEFSMGAEDSDLAATNVEKPQHNLFLPGFWIMATEVTNAQYLACIDAGVCKPPSNKRYPNPLFADWPVTDVSWRQAFVYAKWVGGRLPSEAEWEKACRGTDKRVFPWGTTPPSPELLNFGGSDGIWTNVGSYPAGKSFYGLMDMAGSVMEWTSTLWGSGEDVLWTPDFFYPYNSGDGREETNASDDVYRVIRNGAYDNSDMAVFRCSFRQGYPPSAYDLRIGFRVVSSATPP